MLLYRYKEQSKINMGTSMDGESVYSGSSLEVVCLEYEVKKETKCGYWIDLLGKNKWVSKKTTKRFAYPDKDQAMESFKKRKKRQIKILKANLEIAECALALVNSKKPTNKLPLRFI